MSDAVKFFMIKEKSKDPKTMSSSYLLLFDVYPLYTSPLSSGPPDHWRTGQSLGDVNMYSKWHVRTIFCPNIAGTEDIFQYTKIRKKQLLSLWFEC